MALRSPTSRAFYQRTRDLHLYAGLFVSPFVLVYAISAIVLNHAVLPWGSRQAPPVRSDTVRVAVVDGENSLAVAAQVRRQIGVRGEIGFVSRKPGSPRLSFPIQTPGRTTRVQVDLSAGRATLEQRESGAWDAMIYLHKMPGPHNANIRGNWLFTRLWGWLADTTVYALLFLSASGVYLWTALRADRRTGLLLLGAGVLTFALLVLAVVA
jgi:hypothetical protein